MKFDPGNGVVTGLVLVSALLCGCMHLPASSPQPPSTMPPPPLATYQEAAPPPNPPFLVEATENVSAGFPGAPRLHSFAFAQYGGKWVFIGGRISGFHGFALPEEDFPRATANINIWVVDPTTTPATSYRFPVARLPDSLGPIKDQWVSSNPLYFQDGDTLYIAGGYGQSSTGDFLTYPLLSSVSLPQLIQGVMSGSDTFSNTIAAGSSDLVQSTGGELYKLDDGLFYVVMGHNFTGRYSVFLNNNQQNNDQASQVYLKEIRKLSVTRNRGALSVSLVERFRDESEFARRDLNVVFTMMPDGNSLGLGIHGGVFTPDPEQLNFTKPIYVSKSGPPVIDSSVEQKMSAYECAKVVFYDKASNTNYTTFFGGISRWSFDYSINEFKENPRIGNPNVPVFSDGMPWIDTITTFIRSSSTSQGTTTTITKEVSQPVQNRLPDYLGSEGVFIPAPGLRRYRPDAEIYDFTQLVPGQKTHIGYLYGGIQADPFKQDGTPYNSGQTPTTVSPYILKVYATRPASTQGTVPVQPPR